MLIHKYTVQAPVHLGVFSHDVTRMVYSPPPLTGGRWEKERKKERGRTHEKTTFFLLLSLQFVTTKWHDISLNHVKYKPLGGSCIQYGGGSTRSVQYGTIYFMETGYWLYAPDSPLHYTHTLILIRHYLTVHK